MIFQGCSIVLLFVTLTFIGVSHVGSACVNCVVLKARPVAVPLSEYILDGSFLSKLELDVCVGHSVLRRGVYIDMRHTT